MKLLLDQNLSRGWLHFCSTTFRVHRRLWQSATGDSPAHTKPDPCGSPEATAGQQGVNFGGIGGPGFGID